MRMRGLRWTRCTSSSASWSACKPWTTLPSTSPSPGEQMHGLAAGSTGLQLGPASKPWLVQQVAWKCATDLSLSCARHCEKPSMDPGKVEVMVISGRACPEAGGLQPDSVWSALRPGLHSESPHASFGKSFAVLAGSTHEIYPDSLCSCYCLMSSLH